VKWVIETVGLSEAEHNKRVQWTEKNLTGAAQEIPGAFVYVVVFDDQGRPVRFSGNGVAVSPETEEILRDLIGEDDVSRSA